MTYWRRCLLGAFVRKMIRGETVSLRCSRTCHLFSNVNIVRLRNDFTKHILWCRHQLFWSAVIHVTVHVTCLQLSYSKQNGGEWGKKMEASFWSCDKANLIWKSPWRTAETFAWILTKPKYLCKFTDRLRKIVDFAVFAHRGWCICFCYKRVTVVWS